MIIILCWWLVVGFCESGKFLKKGAGFTVPPPFCHLKRPLSISEYGVGALYFEIMS